MRRFVRVSVVLAACVALPAGAVGQAVVYSQPNDNPDGWASDAVAGQFSSAQLADNFVMADGACPDIVQIRWWGSSDGYEYLHLDNFDTWLVRIHNQVAGLPGYVIYQETFDQADTHPVLTGNQNMDGGYEYRQTVWLSTPVTLEPGTPYWIVVGAHALVPDGDAWIWSRNYFQGDNLCAVDLFDTYGWREREADWAFELTGACCPGGGDSGNRCWADIFPNDDDGIWDPDFDGDCTVDLNDLAQLLGSYGTAANATHEDGDIFPPWGDGVVDLNDLAAFLGQYGDDCTQ